jgi:hypothetical protein
MPQTVVPSMTLVAACQATDKHAVPLTDAFDFSDHLLADALGNYEGRAYKHLWEDVGKNPVNAEVE